MLEERISSDEVFAGRLIHVRNDKVRLTNGRISSREVVDHPGAVGILPITAEGNIVLVRQFRYAVQRELLEIPAGTREPGEHAQDCARRELQEETGFCAGQVEEITRIFVSPGWCNEEIRIFRATELEYVSTNPDEDEVLKILQVSPDEIPGLLRDGEISDAKSVVALLTHLAAPG